MAGYRGPAPWLQISSRISDWVEEAHSQPHRTGDALCRRLCAADRGGDVSLTLYEGFFREMPMACQQNFWQWLGDFGIGLALSFAAMVLLLPLLYAAIRRARRKLVGLGAGLSSVLKSSPW